MLNKSDWWSIGVGIPVIGFLIMILSDNENWKSQTPTKKWVAALENAFGGLSSGRKQSIKAIIRAFTFLHGEDDDKLAYILATTKHESNFMPVRECFATTDYEARNCVSNRAYGVVVNGNVYYGRGFVQLTWDYNYTKLGDDLGIDLFNNPDLALGTDAAAEILVFGMLNGRFTGRRLDQYINNNSRDFYNARRTVNGTDRAELIAGYANSILDNLYLS